MNAPDIIPRGSPFTTCLLLGLLWVLAPAATVFGCPVCHSENGALLRAEIFSPGFGSNLLAIIAPFPILLLLVTAMHFGLPAFPRGKPERQDLRRSPEPPDRDE